MANYDVEIIEYANDL